FPIVVWAGAALLGWIAGEIIAKDPLLTGNLDPASAHTVWMIGATLGALFVICAGLLRRCRLKASTCTNSGFPVGAWTPGGMSHLPGLNRIAPCGLPRPELAFCVDLGAKQHDEKRKI